MKKSKIKKIVLTLLVATFLFTTTVYASKYIDSKLIKLNVNIGDHTNVKDALDDLYDSLTACPPGQVCFEKPKLCRRAKFLHTETCNRTETGDYCSGEGYTLTGSKHTKLITYGNIGTSGTLALGDAFTCDVNGDEFYDEATERFYYLKDEENNTAAFIYYSNMFSDNIDNTAKTTYSNSTTEDVGPNVAMTQLPTKEIWKEVNLIFPERNVKDDLLITKKADFDYTGYVARMLSYEELYQLCYDGTTPFYSHYSLSAKCRFLVEKTHYAGYYTENNEEAAHGYWIESAVSSGKGQAWYIDGYGAYAYYLNTDFADTLGVRPVIEVAKERIEY